MAASRQGALLIHELADEGEIRELLANDPCAEHGTIAEASIYGWNVVVDREAQEARRWSNSPR